ncbi:deoxycytidine triphosphate deaminase [Thalassococcus sp. S3]|uniref:dCTP deaminase domain-containing protein n=1 Tax=Thalassococcus sp. S3 TaxID=2017482 RepID=UPI00102B8225|nr:deoxycytidine triphosphate deaminase [Thalassococcus sp. S3]
MAFWGRKKWLDEGAKPDSNRPVSPWEEEKVEAAGYRLSVGSEYFVNGDGTSTVNQLEDAEAFVIGPGQFAFILTKEKVRISRSSIGFISIRASIKFRGLVNVSGFQVNPGFQGNLVFAVFNAGPRHVNLRSGDEIFSLWIADLNAPVEEDHEESGKIPNNLERIPTDVINGIAVEALTAYQLSEQISELKQQLSTLKESVASVKTWLVRASATLGLILTIVLIVYRAEVVSFFSPNASASNTEVPAETQTGDGQG